MQACLLYVLQQKKYSSKISVVHARTRGHRPSADNSLAESLLDPERRLAWASDPIGRELVATTASVTAKRYVNAEPPPKFDAGRSFLEVMPPNNPQALHVETKVPAKLPHYPFCLTVGAVIQGKPRKLTSCRAVISAALCLPTIRPKANSK
ncbi:hypothetical protein [Methylobacterium nigriterrae]|uniref:hypothetical protein n=1 Tax=Methylobacterium nigriterrae TaxID=3127512 RepID=UPI0030139F08